MRLFPLGWGYFPWGWGYLPWVRLFPLGWGYFPWGWGYFRTSPLLGLLSEPKIFPNKSSLQFVWSSFSTSNFYCKCDQVLTKINEQSVSNRCFNSLVVFSNLCVRCYISVTKFSLILDEAMTVDPAVQHWAHHCTVDLDLVVLSVFSRSLVWIKELLKDQKYFSSISKCHLNTF